MQRARTILQILLSTALLASYAACSDEELEPARAFSDGGTSEASVAPGNDAGSGTDSGTTIGSDWGVPADAGKPKVDAGKKDAGDAGDAGDAATDAADAADAPNDVIVDAADSG